MPSKALLSLTIGLLYVYSCRGNNNKYEPVLTKTIQAHSKAVYYLGWESKKTLVSGSLDNHIKKYTLEKNDLILNLNKILESPILSFAIHPEKSKNILYGMGNGKLLQLPDQNLLTQGQSAGAYCVSFNPHIKNIIACGVGSDENINNTYGKVLIKDTSNNNLFEFAGHTNIVYELSWYKKHHYPNLLATASLDGTIKAWSFDFIETDKSKCLATTPIIQIDNKQLKAYDVEWHPSYPRTCAAAYSNGLIVIYHLSKNNDFKKLVTLDAHTDTVHSIKWHPTERNILLSGSFDGTFKLWNTKTKKCLYSSKAESSNIYFVCWNKYEPHRAAIAYGNGSIKIYDFLRAWPKKYMFPMKSFNDISYKFQE